MSAIENIGCEATGSTRTKNEPQAEKRTVVSGIYGLKNKATGKWYVGQSVDIFKAWHTRYELLHCKSQTKIYRALIKYGYDNFAKVILEECVEEKLNEREEHWSQIYDSVKSGYNTRECGGSRGRHSEETKNKMREKAMGRKHTEESINKMIEIKKNTPKGKEHPNYGKIHNEKSREKIKQARANQIMSEESNIKRAEAMKRVWEERRKNGTIKDVGKKITASKLKEWAVKKSKMVDTTNL